MWRCSCLVFRLVFGSVLGIQTRLLFLELEFGNYKRRSTYEDLSVDTPFPLPIHQAKRQPLKTYNGGSSERGVVEFEFVVVADVPSINLVSLL